MSKFLNKAPSDIYHLDDEVEAWSFDRAVLTFGTALENKLQLVARNAKKQKEADQKVNRELQKWLSCMDDPLAVKGRFRDPMSSMKVRG